jgi:periplasmic copper chaperone A
MKTLAVAAAVLALSVGAAFAQNHKVGDIEITDAWAPATTGAKPTNSAAYMSLVDQGSKPDELIAASSAVAQKVELHVFEVENGVYGMHRVDAIVIEPGAAATILRPGGAHVMLEGLKRPLRAGETFPLTLTFKNAGTLNLQVRVESPQAAVANANDWPGSKASRGLFLKVGKGADRSGPAWPSR